MCKYRRQARKNLKMDAEIIDKNIKIQGTEFDRKRKLTDAHIHRIKELQENGLSNKVIAEMYGVCEQTIRYNTDETYANAIREYQRTTNGKHTGKDSIDASARVAYKKQLIKKFPKIFSFTL